VKLFRWNDRRSADGKPAANQPEPGEAEARVQLGIQCARANCMEEAVEHFRAALSARPDYPSAQNNLGVALLGLGRTDEAAECFARALQLDPGSVESHIALAGLCANGRRLGEAVEHFEAALRLRPSDAGLHCSLGLVLDELGRHDEAKAMLRRAAELAPESAQIAANLRIVASRGAPMWHFSMMNDAERNAAYEAAIRDTVRADDLVFEIGTGSGLLALMAARAGASHVVTCEMAEPIASKARQIVSRNGCGGSITVIARKSTDVRIPQDLAHRAAVLMAEIVSSDLLGEGILESFEDAKGRLLEPAAKIIPRRGSIVCQLVGASGLDRYVRVGNVAGFDLADFNEFTPVKLHPADVDVSFDYYSAPIGLFEFDFQGRAHFPAESKQIAVSATRGGLCQGLLQWIRLELSEGVVYENAPDGAGAVRRAGHWQPVVYPFPQPIEVVAGQVVEVFAAHNRQNLIFHARALAVSG